MAPPAPIDAATCASRIPIPCAVMGTKRRANERHIVSDPKPAWSGAFSFGHDLVSLGMPSGDSTPSSLMQCSHSSAPLRQISRRNEQSAGGTRC
jgi:hypothetical protein